MLLGISPELIFFLSGFLGADFSGAFEREGSAASGPQCGEGRRGGQGPAAVRGAAESGCGHGGSAGPAARDGGRLGGGCFLEGKTAVQS